MILRKEQIQAFSDAARNRYEDRVLAHVNQFFPAECERMGEPAVREEIRYGIERSKVYGIVSQRGVTKYIDLMFVYGRDFDADPELPWAAEILNDPTIHSPVDRINRLFDAGKQFRKDNPRLVKQMQKRRRG